VVASSAAALVSDRAYRPTPTDTSTMIFEKIGENRNLLIFNDYFSDTERPHKNRCLKTVFSSAIAQ
ncbi:hypothetical protein, partial [Sinorhizobium alkalisoli]|uniref:hypothetical protein n=1 Tax=Sinorhizobium alkalisoli TaxID=1752398 RepID=UPI001A976579